MLHHIDPLCGQSEQISGSSSAEALHLRYKCFSNFLEQKKYT